MRVNGEPYRGDLRAAERERDAASRRKLAAAGADGFEAQRRFDRRCTAIWIAALFALGAMVNGCAMLARTWP